MSRISAPLRLALLPGALLALTACPRDKKPERGDSIPVLAQDTTPQDLSNLQPAIPPAAPDTFRQRSAEEIAKATGGSTGGSGGSSGGIPDAPEALMTAVQREQAFTRFCFQEFGQKADPSLSGGVAMIVSVGSGGITGASVGNSRWSSSAGRAVNTCIADKAKQAWKLEPGAVKPGRYVVQLSFRGA